MKYVSLPPGIETGVFVSDTGALAALPEVIAKYFNSRRPQLIADENTWAAAGENAQALCEKAGLSPYPPVIFPARPKPHPDYSVSEKMAADFPAGCLPVAVGSGVINDLVKCAAGIVKTRYCCVATAASVDGYTSSGGAMSVGGLKKTVPCPAPYALIADTDILQTAPAPMMASGYADLMSKITGGADWIIADELGIEAIAPDIWQLVQADLRENLRDHRNLERLFMGLAATGYSMQMYHDSRPASGAEHLCSHVWEMEHLTCGGEEPSHGFKVGIGLLAVAFLQEFIIRTPVAEAAEMAGPAADETVRMAEVSELLKRGCYGSGVPELVRSKTPFGRDAVARRELIFGHWESLQKRLRRQLPPAGELREMLLTAGCPVHYRDIGLDEAQYFHGIRTAQLIRKRYTVLDMLYECGLLETALAALRASGLD